MADMLSTPCLWQAHPPIWNVFCSWLRRKSLVCVVCCCSLLCYPAIIILFSLWSHNFPKLAYPCLLATGLPKTSNLNRCPFVFRDDDPDDSYHIPLSSLFIWGQTALYTWPFPWVKSPAFEDQVSVLRRRLSADLDLVLFMTASKDTIWG